MDIRELTRAEEQVMIILWYIDKGFVRDIIDEYKDPKPAYNTVSTIVRILQNKGFVSHRAFGRSHQYFPIVTKDQYKNASINRLIKIYFDSDIDKLLAFLFREREYKIEDIQKHIEKVEKMLS